MGWWVLALAKTSQAVETFTPGEKKEEIELVFDCADKCKAKDDQWSVPSEIFTPLRSPVTLKFPNESIVFMEKPENAISYFMGDNGSFPKQTQTSFYYDPIPVRKWVEENSSKWGQIVQEPKLKIENDKVVEFVQPKNGIVIDLQQTTINILEAYQNTLNKTKAVAWTVKPNKSLGDSNILGIKELLAKGESNFKGSPKNRRHNIDIGYQKLKGVIVAPGEEFSFNKNICPVTKSSGYLPELVIKAEGTVPEYGGGLCQVSSTVFRAVMQAGLPVTMRKNHSYAVQYYAPQGTDATTYCGGIDFKFKNNTPGSILIWPYLADKDNLVFELYGTRDERVVELSKPVQYDKKPDGSMKATWERVVKMNGEEKKDVFKSVYLSPALFHKQETLDKPTELKVGTQKPR